MNDFLKTTNELISIPSTGDNLAALEQAIALIERQFAGIQGINMQRFVHNDKPSLLVFGGDRKPDEFDVLLSGHLDVVPGKPPQFKPYIHDGYLYGRGAMDMKTTALGMAHALREVLPAFSGLKQGSHPKVGGLFTTQEESKGADVKYLTEHGVIAAKFVIVGEAGMPTEVCTEYKGMAHATIHFMGSRSHESRPWEGKNAITALGKFLGELEKAYPEPGKPVWRTTATPIKIESTSPSANQVPDGATVDISFRQIPGDPNFVNPGRLHSFLKKLLGPTSAKITVYGLERPVKVGHDNPFLEKLASAIETVHHQPARFIRKHGSCDGHFFPYAVVYGMTGEGLHGDNERLEIASIEPYLQTLRQFLIGLQ
ncbi:MAG TPA: M20 family metallopeptidase [Candidatus Saccharimonadales bacterium]|nr:M20 family metallopeptidase [Candidatus Saccharimonadales bacterium]